jgi:hypothetical protein
MYYTIVYALFLCFTLVSCSSEYTTVTFYDEGIKGHSDTILLLECPIGTEIYTLKNKVPLCIKSCESGYHRAESYGYNDGTNMWDKGDCINNDIITILDCTAFDRKGECKDEKDMNDECYPQCPSETHRISKCVCGNVKVQRRTVVQFAECSTAEDYEYCDRILSYIKDRLLSIIINI